MVSVFLAMFIFLEAWFCPIVSSQKNKFCITCELKIDSDEKR